MATLLTWAIQAENSPAHAARQVVSALLNEGVVDKAGGSFQVLQDTGTNMQVKVGSGTAGDLCVIKGDSQADQGSYVAEHQDATATLVIAASDPSDPRIDLIIAKTYDNEADSSGSNKTDIEVVQGTPAAVPSPPALPTSAISLAEVAVGAGVTAIVNGNITDTRVEATLLENVRLSGPLGVLGYAQVTANQSTITTEVDLTGLAVTVDVAASRRIKITGSIRFGATNADNTALLRIKESTTQLQLADLSTSRTSGTSNPSLERSVVLTPSAGSHTYKLTLEMGTGTGSISLVAASIQPAFILVEDLGPV